MLAALLIFGLTAFSSADGEAIEYSDNCVFSSNYIADRRERLFDNNYNSQVTTQEEWAISWTDAQPILQLYYEFGVLPESTVSLEFYDAALAQLETQTVDIQKYSGHIDVPEEARRLNIVSEADFSICTLRFFGEGNLPEEIIEWDRDVEELDYLVCLAHVSDEINMGAAIVSLEGNEGASGGTVYFTTANRESVEECFNANRALGLEVQPTFLNLEQRLGANSVDSVRNLWDEREVLLSLVKIIRERRPSIIIIPSSNETLDAQDALVSQLTLQAIELAQDTSFDTESAEFYGTWQVKKAYEHLGENAIAIQAEQTVLGMGERTIFEIVSEANDCYFSLSVQLNIDTVSNFGLVLSNVGNDIDSLIDNIELKLSETTVGNDLSNIDNFASPIPVTAPPADGGTGLMLSNDDDNETVYIIEEPTQQDESADEQGGNSAFLLLIAGAAVSVLLFIFAFKWLRYNRSTVAAIIICLLPFVFVLGAYILITNI